MATVEATAAYVLALVQLTSLTASSAAQAELPEPELAMAGSPGTGAADDASLKRKASDDTSDSDSPKRARHDPGREPTTEQRPSRSPSATHGHLKEVASDADQDRRMLAAQEEKKRGRRLFGGLMSTLSQTSNTSQQQKRRLEIERKQQERMQKQKSEDEDKRAAKLERLHEVRMAEQIAFEEEVMRNKNKTRLLLARFLRTRAEPRIYYLPWKPTPEQEDIIDDQILEANESMAREVERFMVKKQRHIERHGPPTRQRSATPEETAAAMAPAAESSVRSPCRAAERSPEQQPQEQPAQSDPYNHQHDESGDVLVEAEEDMVIY